MIYKGVIAIEFPTEFNLIMLFRLLIASICGIIIGYERQTNFKVAGVKTHMIVAFSASLIMVVSKYGFYDSEVFDASRIASQLITGIGFVGAGIIYKRHYQINGLTTAAGILATAAIGLAIGAGLYAIGLGGTCMFLVLRLLVQRTEKLQTNIQSSFKITLKNTTDLGELHDVFDGLKVLTYAVELVDQDLLSVDVTLLFVNEDEKEFWMKSMMQNRDIVKFSQY